MREDCNMCFFGGNKPPKVIEGPPAPTESNVDADTKRSEAGLRRMAAAQTGGRQSTIQNLGGGAGLDDDPDSIFKTTMSA